MKKHSSGVFREYSFAAAVVAVCTAISFAMFPFFALTNLVMVYLVGTLVVAARGYRTPAALSAILGVLSFDFFFVPPRFTLTVSDAQYLLTFTVMFAVAMIISQLTVRLREEAEAARAGQARTTLMHEFTQQLATSNNVQDILTTAVRRLSETFSSAVFAFLPDSNGALAVRANSGNAELSQKDFGVAQWVFDTGQVAGQGTESLPETNALYVPIPGTASPVGVLCSVPRNSTQVFDSDQRKLLESFAHQIGLSIEVEHLQENTRKAEVEIEAERMRSALLSSVSHDFRTPLTAIVGSAGALLGKKEIQQNKQMIELVESIQSEGERLSRLVQNLLEATRLESGAVKLNKELYPLEEVIGSALGRLEKILKDREIKVAIPEEFPLVPLDGLLMEQVFVNLLENAARHTPAKSPIEISVQQDGKSARISIADRGPGLKKEELGRVFDKFYRSQSSPGAGLGLSICQAIVKAHHGSLWAENRPDKGAVFIFTLLLEDSHEI